MLLFHLFIAFGRANILGYGGGPSAIPLVKAEVVDTFKWLSDAEFADTLAIGNTLPGPIATKMAAYIGYKVGGVSGAVSALLGTVLPTALMMILLGALLYRFRDSEVIKGMIKAVKPVVFSLFVLLALDFLPFARPDKAGWLPFGLAVASFAAIYFFKVHQALTIFAAIIIGGIFVR